MVCVPDIGDRGSERIYGDKGFTNRRDNLVEASVDEEGLRAGLVLPSEDRVVKHDSELWLWTSTIHCTHFCKV